MYKSTKSLSSQEQVYLPGALSRWEQRHQAYLAQEAQEVAYARFLAESRTRAVGRSALLR